MAGCLAARTANHRSNEPPPSFAWGDPLHAIAPVPENLLVNRSQTYCCVTVQNRCETAASMVYRFLK